MLKPTNHGILPFLNRIFLFEISATIWMDVFEKSIDLMFIVTFNDTKNGTENILLNLSIKNFMPIEIFALQSLISNIWSEYIHLPIVSRFATKSFLKFRNTTLKKIDFLLSEVSINDFPFCRSLCKSVAFYNFFFHLRKRTIRTINKNNPGMAEF